MGNILRKAVENKRKKLIEKLIAFNVYKKEDKHLFELSLTELENEYRRFQSLNHFHSDLGSIQLISKKSKH
ncbi:Fur-regulated basic protein FbpA [Bacillus sp. sid0103]|uniref:Fur-regulated basic protein FbpA n=1 Tax=Bacillus sp. sid0103 TaxID=2856337 RepID=UPI001C458C27|nr:Fur-regulated basic protein FbpA [Bacillus sp. sid0103]MBV7504901.1 Fur-regulated basic protein FbpA [Bacillus sp. sid0103]